MGDGPKTGTSPSRPSASIFICGLASLALVAVLGLSLASRPAAGEGEAVRIVTRLTVIDTAAEAGAWPFGVAGCAAGRLSEARRPEAIAARAP